MSYETVTTIRVHITMWEEVVPRTPGTAGPGDQCLIAMQPSRIGGVGERSQHVSFLWRTRCQEAQCRVGMSRHDHAVEYLQLVALVSNFNVPRRPRDRPYRCRHMHGVEPLDDALDIRA